MSLDPVLAWLGGLNLLCYHTTLIGDTVLVSYLTDARDVFTWSNQIHSSGGTVQFPLKGADILISPVQDGSGYYVNDANHPIWKQGFLIPDVNTLQSYLMKVIKTIGNGGFWSFSTQGTTDYPFPPSYLYCMPGAPNPTYLLSPILMAFSKGTLYNPTIMWTGYNGDPRTLPTPPNVSPVIYPPPPPGPLLNTNKDWILILGAVIIFVIILIILLLVIWLSHRRRQK